MRESLLDNDAFRARLNRRILCEIATDQRRVALTFDDGPSPRNTPPLLDMLRGKGIRATFFVVGKRVDHYRDILRRIAAEGHEVGNHTYQHLPLIFMPRGMVRSELERTNNIIAGEIGSAPKLFRPPMGWFNDSVLGVAGEVGLRPVIGSIHPRDSRKPGTEALVRRVMPRIAPGAIIILHDGGWRISADRSQTLDAVDRITDQLMEANYTVGSLGKLLEDCEYADGQIDP